MVMFHLLALPEHIAFQYL